MNIAAILQLLNLAIPAVTNVVLFIETVRADRDSVI